MANEFTLALKEFFDRIKAAALPGGVLDGFTVEEVLGVEAITKDKLPYIGIVPERSGQMQEENFISSQAKGYIDIGVRILEDSKYAYYWREYDGTPFIRGLMVCMEKFMDAVDGIDLTGSANWTNPPEVELLGFMPAVNDMIGYGFKVRIYTNIYVRGRLSA